MAEVAVSLGGGVHDSLPISQVEQAARWVLARHSADDATISIALLSDDDIARLNERYLSHSGPTDVISFPLHLPSSPVVGDIYIGAEQASRQASEMKVPLAEELARLAIHGTLHVLGYSHPDGEEREGTEMYQLQEELLAGFLASSSEER
ncbi:MAG TPA: rRNA maturation RNase YbeY [Longimicrobiaceae bacterium]|nr:rRNA maturation RNase YbeY [Longimicrobiaceae bacterium]